jgi:PEP-CTERM motif
VRPVARRRSVRFRHVAALAGALALAAAPAGAFFWDSWPGSNVPPAEGTGSPIKPPPEGGPAVDVPTTLPPEGGPAVDVPTTLPPEGGPPVDVPTTLTGAPSGLPEPATIVGGLIGLGVVAAMRRRRRS